MKIAICQLNSTVGNFTENLDKIEEVVENLNFSRADLFVFPELFLTGYPPRDLLEHQWFIQQGADAIDRLKAISKTIPEKAIITGIAFPTEEDEGSFLHNSAIVISNGSVIFTQHKSLLPTYDVFDEHRYFKEAKDVHLFTFKGRSIGLTICEDMWNTSHQHLNRRYKVNPVGELAEMGADLIINIAASPFFQEKQQERLQLIHSHVAQHKIPFLLVNSVGANDELIFDGGSLYVSGKGKLGCELPFFEEALQIIDLDEPVEECTPQRADPIAAVHDALVLGIRDYFAKCGFTEAVVGLSGGIDSAVTAALAVEALGTENVQGITLPSQFSSEGSVSDSKMLAENLGITCSEIAIKEIHNSVLNSLSPLFTDTEPGLAEENIQARIRGILLMAMANKFGKLVLNTGNKSEMAVGYCTLYGDMNGALSVLGDIYKTDVYRLAYYINRKKERIPVNTINKPPSAELRPDQKDEDTLPQYDDLDAILRMLLEEDKSSDDVVAAGYAPEIVEWVVRAIKINEYKRRQSAPILKVTPKAFGMGRRFPIAAKYEW